MQSKDLLIMPNHFNSFTQVLSTEIENLQKNLQNLSGVAQSLSVHKKWHETSGDNYCSST